MNTHTDARDSVPVKSLALFLGLTFGLTWGIALLLVLFPDQIFRLFGELSMSHPLFILAVYSPGIAGLLVVTRHAGAAGLSGFLKRLALWRASGYWWLFLVLGIPALMYGAAALKGTIRDPFPFSPWYDVFPALALALFLGPVEELGWRGVALPLLQRRFAPLGAGLLLGLIWAVWHIPAFLIGGTPQSAWDFLPYFVGVIAISAVMTGLFNASRGSLLTAVIAHFQFNNPIFPDAQPWDTYLLALFAATMVLVHRQAYLRRDQGVTAVVVTSEGENPVLSQPNDSARPRASAG